MQLTELTWDETAGNATVAIPTMLEAWYDALSRLSCFFPWHGSATR